MSGLKDEKLIKSKRRFAFYQLLSKGKHAHSIVESFEYICQISSKLVLIILNYTVSNLVHFF